MTVSKIYIARFINDNIVFTNNKEELVVMINDFYKNYDLFIPYTIKRINHIIHVDGNLDKHKELKEFHSIDMTEYYKDFLEQYRDILEKKNYKPSFVERKVKIYMKELYEKERLLRDVNYSNNKEELHKQLKLNEKLN